MGQPKREPASTEIVVPDGCGNSPRAAWLLDFNLAFIGGEVEKALDFVAEDITWDLVGEGTIEGREGMRAWLEAMFGKRARRVEFEYFITHSRTAAVNGSYEMESGSGFRFCDVYEFRGAASDSPISNYTSYVIRI